MSTDSRLAWLNRKYLAASTEFIASWLALGLGCVFLVAAITGAVYNFSPVPYGDMWNGYLDFYLRILDGDYSAWWYQHVDHRLIASRILFFIDLRVFDGTLWFLILADYLIAFAVWMTICKIASLLLPGAHFRNSRRLYAGVSLALIFSWLQKENLVWAFQGQMFAAILFPMLAFVLFYQAERTTGRKSTLYFSASLAAGAFAAGTMMNGLAALPIVFLLGMLLRASRLRMGLVAVLAVTVIGLYLWGFTPSRSFSESLLSQPTDVLTFFLAYVGAPAHYIFGDAFTASVVTGSVIALGLVGGMIGTLRRPVENQAIYVVFAICLYGVLSGLGVASARIYEGMENAFFSRYMTNVVALWAAVLLLLLYLARSRGWSRALVFSVMLAIPLGLLPVQLGAFGKDGNALADRLVLATALELGIRDPGEITNVYPWNDRGPDYMSTALTEAKVHAAKNLSIFGNPLLQDVAKSLGQLELHRGVKCLGDIETKLLIPGESRFAKIEGWLIDESTARAPESLYVLDASRRIVGYGVTGFSRQGLIKSAPVSEAGFVAYVRKEFLNDNLILKGRDLNCETSVPSASALLFTPISLIDENWVGGVARSWGPTFLIPASGPFQDQLAVGKRVKFSDGEIRLITKVEAAGQFLIVHVDGAFLDGAVIGYPHKIELLP